MAKPTPAAIQRPASVARDVERLIRYLSAARYARLSFAANDLGWSVARVRRAAVASLGEVLLLGDNISLAEDLQ